MINLIQRLRWHNRRLLVPMFQSENIGRLAIVYKGTTYGGKEIIIPLNTTQMEIPNFFIARSYVQPQQTQQDCSSRKVPVLNPRTTKDIIFNELDD